ncbi:hypothetical protein GCM10010342_76630 [Streptomyces anulatus]|nr:hypothetical protein GCM10010342_76630 [Streptomyces anulatus]
MGLLLDEPLVLLAQHADFQLLQTGLLALLGEFRLDLVDVVLGMAQALVLGVDLFLKECSCAFRGPRVVEGLGQLPGEFADLRSRTSAGRDGQSRSVVPARGRLRAHFLRSPAR